MSIRVLLADDHSIVREGLRLLLQTDPEMVVVGEAEQGRDALEKVETLRPDVAIIDIAMPELNGLEVIERIVGAGSKCRSIVLSMYSNDDHIVRAIKVGAWGYLLKETAGREVIDAVRTVSMGRRYLSQKLLARGADRLFANPVGPLDQLSRREREVLQMVVEGQSSALIAEKLQLSPKTVETYRSRIMTKLDVPNLASLVKFAIQHGITPLEIQEQV